MMEKRSKSVLLVVEDEMPMARAILDRLKSEDFQVKHAKNGKEGLEMAESEAFDVIILDIAMPKMDGMEMMHRLRHKQGEKHTPIIIYTNMVPDEDIVEGVTEDKPTFYLSKTTHSIDYLVDTIEKIIS